jgi:hypothetical protein
MTIQQYRDEVAAHIPALTVGFEVDGYIVYLLATDGTKTSAVRLLVDEVQLGNAPPPEATAQQLGVIAIPGNNKTL